MIIRQASIEDIPAIRAIVDITWPVTYGAILSEEQINYMIAKFYSDEKLREQMTTEGHHFFISVDEGKAVGFCAVELNNPLYNTLKLHKIYILPDQQGKNLGRKLIDLITEFGSSHNQNVISLNVNRYNKAKTFYEKLGFEVKYEEDIAIGNGYLMEDYVMELKIEKSKLKS